MTSSSLVLLLLLIAVSGEENNGIRRLRRVQIAMSDATPIKVGCTIDTSGGATGCDVGQYCKKDKGECLTKNFGTCEAKSQICPMMYMPVCGCDGETYGNSCTASGAGQSVAYMGECQGNVVVVDIHGGDDEVGSCNRQEECYATIRSQKPIDSSMGVELCGCYAASSTAPFDECEGNVESCAMAKCMNTCEGLEAYCDLAAREENGMGELGECKLRLMEESEPMIIESMSMTENPMSLIIDGIINGGSISMNIDASSMSFQYNEIPSLLPDVNIFETTWMAHSIDLDVDIMAPITLEFDSESMYGTAGCNKYSGGVVNFTDNSFTTKGHFATTRMYCAEVGVMEQEDAVLNFLQDKTFSYEVIDTHLNLDSRNGVKAQFVADFQ